MDRPQPPEMPNWIEGPLVEVWELGKRHGEGNRLFDAEKASIDFDTSPGGRARNASILAWTQYYSETDAQGESNGAD